MFCMTLNKPQRDFVKTNLIDLTVIKNLFVKVKMRPFPASPLDPLGRTSELCTAPYY